MSGSLGEIVEAHPRRHLLLAPSGLEEAARFLVNSLLLSHSIRRDTLALVRLGSTILVAPGSRLRQLRPDQESAEGWVRAVLRGKARGLGAIIASPREAALALRGATILTTCNGTASRPGPASLKHPLSIIHSTGTGRCWLHAPCGPSCRAALANIVVDRLLAGLPP